MADLRARPAASRGIRALESAMVDELVGIAARRQSKGRGMSRPFPFALGVALVLLRLGLAPAFAAPRSPARADFPPVELRELSWRSVGPANMGGRISGFAAVEKKPSTFFAATGTGGLFKTANFGTTWN